VKQDGRRLQAIFHQMEKGVSTLKDPAHFFPNGFHLDKSN
jgi:hypothetical protein